MLPIGTRGKLVSDTGVNAPHLIKPRYLDGLLASTTGRAEHLAKNVVDHAAMESGHHEAVRFDRTSVGGEHMTATKPGGVMKSHEKKSATKPRSMGQVPYAGPKY